MNTPKKNPLPLEYSSPANEESLERQAERERIKALETYNESTFGQRRYVSLSGVVVLFSCALPFFSRSACCRERFH